MPYFESGGGVGSLDFDLKDQADGLIFYPQAGLGLHYFVTKNISADIGWRFHHMSNANTQYPNILRAVTDAVFYRLIFADRLRC